MGKGCALQFRSTLSIGFGTITMIFLVFGATGYIAFGEETQEVITYNLPNDWSTQSVKIALSLALFFTFPIMMVPVYEVVERSLESAPWFYRNVAPGRRCAPACGDSAQALRVLVLLLLTCSDAPSSAFFSISSPG